jgi:hypothetical protein
VGLMNNTITYGKEPFIKVISDDVNRRINVIIYDVVIKNRCVGCDYDVNFSEVIDENVVKRIINDNCTELFIPSLIEVIKENRTEVNCKELEKVENEENKTEETKDYDNADVTRLKYLLSNPQQLSDFKRRE